MGNKPVAPAPTIPVRVVTPPLGPMRVVTPPLAPLELKDTSRIEDAAPGAGADAEKRLTETRRAFGLTGDLTGKW